MRHLRPVFLILPIVAGLSMAAGAALADPDLAPAPAWMTGAGADTAPEVAAAADTEAPPTNAELVAGAAEVRDAYGTWRGATGAARTAALLGLLASLSWLLIGVIRRLQGPAGRRSQRAKKWLPRIALLLGAAAAVLTAAAGGEPLLVALAAGGPPLSVFLHELFSPQRT